MDEREPFMKKGDVLPDEDDVYRIVLTTIRDKKNKAIPALRCFDLSDQDGNKLSVDWERKTTPEKSIARVGASFKFKKKAYKAYDNRELYAMNVGFLQSLKDIDRTIYDPLLYSQKIKGRPDNPSHSLVVFHFDFLKDRSKRPETIVRIRNHAKDRRVSVDFAIMNKLVDRWRKDEG